MSTPNPETLPRVLAVAGSVPADAGAGALGGSGGPGGPATAAVGAAPAEVPQPDIDRGILPAAPAAPVPLAAFGAAVDWVVVAIGATMIVLVFVNVCLHAFGRDLAWVTELAELLMVWVTFLGGACATRRGVQMTITEFIDKLDGGARRAADAAVDLVAAALLVVLIVYGARLAAAGWGNELTVLGIPMTFQYLGMPVGAAAALVWVLWDLWRITRGDTRAMRWGG